MVIKPWADDIFLTLHTLSRPKPLERIIILDFVHRLMFLRNTGFWKLGLFLSSGKMMGAPTLLAPLERANLNHWTQMQFPKRVFLETSNDGQSQKT
jgi:hypothetical protein